MLVLIGLAEDADPEAYIGFVFVIYWGFHTSGYRLGSDMWVTYEWDGGGYSQIPMKFITGWVHSQCQYIMCLLI